MEVSNLKSKSKETQIKEIDGKLDELHKNRNFVMNGITLAEKMETGINTDLWKHVRDVMNQTIKDIRLFRESLSDSKTFQVPDRACFFNDGREVIALSILKIGEFVDSKKALKDKLENIQGEIAKLARERSGLTKGTAAPSRIV